MSEYLRKRHNVSVLYHLVCPAKYSRVVFTQEVDACLKYVCLEVAKRYEIRFIEIGTDNDHVHFWVQSVPTYIATQVVRIIKSLTAREIFKISPIDQEATMGWRVVPKVTLSTLLGKRAMSRQLPTMFGIRAAIRSINSYIESTAVS